MVGRLPCEYYLKYLVSHPDGYPDRDIEEMVRTQGLDWLDASYLQRVRKQTSPPAPFTPYDREHTPSQYFINKHRIWSLYFKDDATRCALSIVARPRVKEFCEAMLLSGAPPGLIAQGVQQALGVEALTGEGVLRFQHYFWNMGLLDFTEMRALINHRGTSRDVSYKKAHYKDSRRIAVNLPTGPMSALLAQIRMGITPKGVNFAELMERVRLVAGVKAYAALLEDGRESAMRAKDYISTAQGASELMERASPPEEKLRERFNAMTIEYDPIPVPHIGELSAGNHTTDLQPTDSAQQVVEVDSE